jgi:hypothetical protein
MRHSLRLAQIAELNLKPVASVEVTRQRLLDLGIAFEYGTDDLDEYEIAAFEVPGDGLFALSRYNAAPSDNFDLLLDESSASEPALSAKIRCIAKELGLAGSSFSWLVDGQLTRLADPVSPIRQHA